MRFFSPDSDKSQRAIAPLSRRRGVVCAGIGLAIALLILAVAMVLT